MQRIIMPQVGQDIESARIIEWCRNEGEPVEKGDVVVVVESDKAAFEIEAEQSGVLLKILHEVDEDVAIFAPIGYIGQPGETIEEPTEKAATPGRSPLSPQAPPPPEPKKTTARILASPSARRLAAEHSVDLTQVKGTGPSGRITSADVLSAASGGGDAKAAAAPVAAKTGERIVPFSKMRRRIAERLTESSRSIPHFYLSLDVDMSDALVWRRNHNDKAAAKVTITDLVVKACAAALSEFEMMNAHAAEDRIILKNNVNVGLAVGTDEGLLVPVIADTDRKSVDEIAAAARIAAENARRGALRSSAEGTFTVSSLGMHGIREFLPIINPPECGILAVGAVEKRLVPAGDGFAAREMLTLVLACDHRAVDGVYAAGFLNRVKQCLESPVGSFDVSG